MDDGRHDDAVRGAVAPKAIGDEATRHLAVAPQQFAKEPPSGMAIPARLEQDVDDVAVLVDGAPQILPLPADGDEEFVEMPGVADVTMTPPEAPGVGTAKGLTPVPHRFVRDGDAAVCEEVLNLAETEAESIVEPDPVADDDRREPDDHRLIS